MAWDRRGMLSNAHSSMHRTGSEGAPISVTSVAESSQEKWIAYIA